jgi:putative Holliday junction resolvase
MKFLGLDIGDQRVGVAFGDSELRLATPVDVFRRASMVEDVETIGKFAREYEAERLIVGLPRNMDGTTGAQAEAVTFYAGQIARALNLPIIFWDERLTTVEATRRTQETGRRGKKARRGLDAIAAAVILQDYLDGQRHGE